MLNEKILTAINEQINYEFYSSYIYRGMQVYFHSIGLEGFAHWMGVQTEEETYHSLKLINFIQDQDASVTLDSIKAVTTSYESPVQTFEVVLKHERGVTQRINKLMSLAKETEDYATQGVLQWFVDEQVEEEKNVKQILDTLKLTGNDGSGIIILDRELAQRPKAVMPGTATNA